MEIPKNDEPRREPGRHQKLAAEYKLLSLIANLFGSIFWWAECRRWRVADELADELEVQR
jgi:hypothetical protein